MFMYTYCFLFTTLERFGDKMLRTICICQESADMFKGKNLAVLTSVLVCSPGVSLNQEMDIQEYIR